MATIAEHFRGISGNQDERIIRYIVEDAMSDQDALNVAELAAPFSYDLMPRQNIRVIEQAKYAFEVNNRNGQDVEEQKGDVADGLYYVEAVYSRRRGTQPTEQTDEKPDPADTEGNHNTFSFEQTLETIKIREAGVPTKYTSFGVGTSNPNPDDAIKFTGINTQPDGTVEGADIRSPIGTFAYDYYPDKGSINQAYLDTVTGLVGSVNDDVFFLKPAGTVLFIGATGRKRNQTDWEFNFRFEFRPNQTDVTIGEGSNAITYSRLGHQYVWVYYDEISDTNVAGETRSILVPRQVNVHDVYPSADLTGIFPP